MTHFFICIKLSYYWHKREELSRKATDRYYNKGGKEKASKHYRDNIEVLRKDVGSKYRNLSEK